jgi:DNA-directed RNA polymerase, mitochondrial
MVNKQLEIEQNFLKDAQSKYDNMRERMIEVGIFGASAEGAVLKRLSFDNIAVSLEAYMSTTGHRGHGAKIQQFIADNFKGRAEVLAYTIIEVLLNRVGKNKTQLTNMTIALVNSVLNLLSVEDFKRNEPKFYSYLEYEYKSRGIGYINSRKLKLASKTGNKVIKEGTFKASVGSVLIDCVLSSGSGLFELVSYRNMYTNHVERHITLTQQAFDVLARIRNKGIISTINYKPLVVEPIPWDNLYGNGGYITPNNITFIKHTKNHKALDMINNMNVDITRLYDVVNGIQKTKWSVNTKILEVVDTIIDNNLVNPSYPTTNPVLYGDIPYMESINIYKAVPKEKYGALDEKGTHINIADYKKWFTDKEIQLKKLETIKSKRILFVLALNTAREYTEYPHFYFTYNCDFRGRLYPIQQLFNPQATGAIKALLQYADGALLTEDGLYWLKIHIANTYGLDKSSYEDRVLWVDNNIERLVKWAEKPLDCLKEWNEADEPLMFLAGIIALQEHLKGMPVHLPISLDATCSGLQIYAGLLKDAEGASVVNVTNSGIKPADVYTDVAIKAESYLESGEYPTQYTFTTKDGTQKSCSTITEANDLQGNISRKLTKRNVMTVPYSVTKRGMFDQVRELLDELEDNNKHFWKGDKWIVAKLLVDLNSRGISEIVKGASIGQTFVKNVVRNFYLNNEDKPLVWKTPFFSFPVIQWKNKTAQKRVKTVLGNLSLRFPTGHINKQQQNNGVAPNLIHSLDATIEYLTVETLLSMGVKDFMLIHDSFGVPANDVPKLNIAVREAYITLFESNPLASWVNQIDSKYSEEAESIMLNTLDLNDVRDSRYIFS